MEAKKIVTVGLAAVMARQLIIEGIGCIRLFINRLFIRVLGFPEYRGRQDGHGPQGNSQVPDKQNGYAQG